MKQLRKRAEAALADGRGRRKISGIHELPTLQRELELHHVELEMQNDELRRVQRELDESHRRYRELFEHAPVAYVTITRDGVIAEANARAGTLFGLPPVRLRGARLGGFVRSSDSLRFEQHRRRVFEHHEASVELEMRRSDGTFVPIRFESALGGPASPRARIALIDLTQIREAHAALLQAQKIDALGALASGIAHDFNNVLMALQGSVEILRDELEADGSPRMLLDEMQACVERATAVTARLRAFSRKEQPRASVFHFDAFVARSLGVLRRLVDERIELTSSLRAEDARVRAAQGEIDQVLMNLVVNARDALPDGGAITVTTRDVEVDERAARDLRVAPGRWVELTVRDDGRGIPDGAADRLFEPFFTTKAEGKGTGLGLAIVHNIVTRAGGRIRATSVAGEGAAFSVLLPVTDDPPDTVVQEPVGSPPRGSETILLVEDDDLVRSTTKYRLERAGYRVLEAASPAAAVECVARFPGPIALVLTDFALRGGDGADVARMLRQLRPRIAVAMMSAHDVDETRARFAGAVLQKPFTAGVLLRFVRRAIEEPADEVPAARETKRTLLLVEDNDSARLVLKAYLERLGWSVCVAASAATALKLFRSRTDPPELLLTDYELPDGIGRALAHELRAIAPTLRVAYITGHDEIPDTEPGDPVLTKPIDLRRLARTLDELVAPS